MKVLKKYWPIILIVVLSLALRLYRISEYMTFLGDEGRDALVWLKMIREGKLTLIGPQTSIGNMYLGPLFYYLMLPFYFFFGTVGPSIGTALMAGATTAGLWYVGRTWFGEKAGLMAAFFYAISPQAIVLSRSAWNPNIMPFFALLVIWGIWQFWQKKNYHWLAAEGIFLSIVVQSHYLGLLLAPVVLIFFLLSLRDRSVSKTKYLLLAIFYFLLLTVAPLIWFDLRHNFINFQAFNKCFSERQTTVNLKFYKAIPEIWPLWRMLATRLIAGKNSIVGFWLSAIGLIAIIANFKKMSKSKPFVLLLTCIFIGLLGMGLYKQHIYDHYFGFLFPAVFLLLGAMLEKLNKILLIILFLVLTLFSLRENPWRYPPSKQLEKTQKTTEEIKKLSGGKPYNLALIAKQNYDAGYRYFLEKWQIKPLSIDAQKISTTVSGQLFVICEEKVCEPINHPQAEIANFGWAKIENEWELPWGVRLFKLIHYVP